MHTIFLIHGMGDPADNWHEKAETNLRDAYGELGLGRPFDSVYKIETLNYNQIFADYLNDLDSQNDRFALVENFLQTSPNGLIEAVVKAARKDPTDEFIYTHVADVLFYSMTDKQGQVIAEVQTRLGQKLNAGQSWSVIAFSLGTRVIHDVLQSNYTAGTNFRQAFGKPQCLMTVANVGRVLQELVGGDLYNSEVRPSTKVDEGGCTYYLNVRHELDPFTYPKPFRPPLDWQLSGEGNTKNMYRDIVLPAEDTFQANVHDLAHYLRNPRSTRAFFTFTYEGPQVRNPLIDDNLFERMYNDYQQQTPVGQVERIIEELDKLKAQRFSSWQQIHELWTRFAKIVKKFGGTINLGKNSV